MLLKWIITLPLFWQISLPILFMVLVTVIALYGKLWFSIGKNKIGIGGDKLNKKKRSCMDCSMFHRAAAAKTNRKIAQVESGITKNKMNYAEQKLLELKRTLYKEFSRKIKESDTSEEGMINLNDRIKLILNETIKDEVRRSFKENGFHEREGNKFTEYAENQTTTILDLFEEDFMVYYDNDMIIEILDSVKTDIYDTVYSIYDNAKNVELETLEKIKKIEVEHDATIDSYMGGE